MKAVCLSILIMVWSLSAFAQDSLRNEPVNSTLEQQLENITAGSDDEAPEDDSYLQEMAAFAKDPINLNDADAATLQLLRILTPMQIQNLLSYRQRLGPLLSIYEVQAVPGWDIATINRVRPFIMVAQRVSFVRGIKERLKMGDNRVLLRTSRMLETSEGYRISPNAGRSYYTGSPEKLMLRYKYSFKTLLQYGITAEKDAGEQFLKGGQKLGFDFYSAHFFARNLGNIKAIALGDFTVNMGQGLTSWMTLAFRKGPDAMAVKRQAPVLKPYNSSGEIYFHRGAGITIGRNKWETTAFASYRRLDGNFTDLDTAITTDDYVSSLQTSGYHRTPSEIADKNIQRQLAFGGNFRYRTGPFSFGLNAVQYELKLPLQKEDEPYNLFALNGKHFGNYSFDFGFTRRNYHVFGELAVSEQKAKAVISGLLLSLSSKADMSFVYRNISPKYQSLYGAAFTESSHPNNEKGFFSGITIRPVYQWRIDAYADFYKFPWLKYRVDAPSAGNDYFVQVTYKPNKQTEMYLRFKNETKAINRTITDSAFHTVADVSSKNFRLQFQHKLSTALTLRSRAEMVWYDKNGPMESTGFSLNADVLYKPMMSPFGGNLRLQYFETDDYNARIYTFENDVLYYYAIPVFYGKGYRAYLNANYDISRRLSLYLKIARTVYPDTHTVGSGLDLIKKNHRSEVRLQAMLNF